MLIASIIYVVFTFSVQYLAVADSDNQTAVTNSARNAMTEAINLGNQRVNEKVTINEDVAIEATLRMYAATSDFEDGARYLNIHEVNSDPAYIAVDSYLEIWTPFKRTVNKYLENPKSAQPNIARSREIVIYEAKPTVRPSKE
ncbi:hypothetical protein ACP3VS_18690 [Lysinibacillus sp. VIII_CA]